MCHVYFSFPPNYHQVAWSFKHVRNLCDLAAANRIEIAASLQLRFSSQNLGATKVAYKSATKIACVNGPLNSKQGNKSCRFHLNGFVYEFYRRVLLMSLTSDRTEGVWDIINSRRSYFVFTSGHYSVYYTNLSQIKKISEMIFSVFSNIFPTDFL